MKTLCRDGLKGQKALSPGHRPGCKDVGKFALKGQKPYLVHYAFALTGRRLRATSTQGDALGWELIGLSGRFYTGFSLLAQLELINKNKKRGYFSSNTRLA